MAADALFPVKKLVNLTGDQARLISDFRFDNRLKSDNEAIRTLIERGLGVRGRRWDNPDASAGAGAQKRKRAIRA